MRASATFARLRAACARSMPPRGRRTRAIAGPEEEDDAAPPPPQRRRTGEPAGERNLGGHVEDVAARRPDDAATIKATLTARATGFSQAVLPYVGDSALREDAGDAPASVLANEHVAAALGLMDHTLNLGHWRGALRAGFEDHANPLPRHIRGGGALLGRDGARSRRASRETRCVADRPTKSHGPRNDVWSKREARDRRRLELRAPAPLRGDRRPPPQNPGHSSSSRSEPRAAPPRRGAGPARPRPSARRAQPDEDGTPGARRPAHAECAPGHGVLPAHTRRRTPGFD